MAQTGKLGIVDSLLANVQLALAAADPTLPAITTQGGALGGQLGDTILALAGVEGPLTFNLTAESVLALAQTANPDPAFVPHASPHWVLGGHDSQLGGMEPGFDGERPALPTPTTETGLLGTALCDMVLGLDGVAGPRVFYLAAESVLALTQTADSNPTFVAHASQHWVLGGQDSCLGSLGLAYAGAPDLRPLTGSLTGKLGTAGSLLAGVRLALGEQEGEGSGGIIVEAASTLSLETEAEMEVVRLLAAESIISLTSVAGRNNLLDAGAESTLSLDAVAEFTVARAVAASSEVPLTSEAGRNNLPSVSAESVLGLAGTADFDAVHVLAAESVLSLSQAASGATGLISEVAGESTLALTAAASFTAVHVVAASNTLDLTSAAGRNNLPNLTAESPISLTSAAERNNLPNLEAESTISLTSEAARNSFPAVTAESTLSLTGEAEGVNFPALFAESALSLADEAVCIHRIGHRGAVWDFLPLWHEATVSVVRNLAAQNTIELIQTEHTARPWYVSAESPVQIATPEYDPDLDELVWRFEGLQDMASVARPLTAAAHHSIPLQHMASAVRVKPTAIEVSAESVLELLGEVRINPTGTAGDWLVIQQQAAVEKCKRVRSTLALSQEAAVIVSVPRVAASILGLTQAATYSIVSRGSLQNYTPFSGEGPVTPPPVVLEAPEYVSLPFQLFYPAEGVVTDSVALRAPNLGNKDRLSFNRILRETRGGTLIVFADPIWPKIQTLVLTFSGLRSIQTQQLLAFLETHLGEEIGLLDWEGRTWKGIVTTPDQPVVQDGKDSFSARLEFEGELVPA